MGATAKAAVSLRLPDDVSERRAGLARQTGRTKTFYMIETIRENRADLEDDYIARQLLAEIDAGRSRSWTLEEVERDLGLAD